MAIMALELQMSDLENLTRHGLTLGPPIHDDQLTLQHAGARCGKTNALCSGLADVMSKYRYDVVPKSMFARVDPGGKDNTVISPPMVRDYWREAKLAEARRVLPGFAHYCQVELEWPHDAPDTLRRESIKSMYDSCKSVKKELMKSLETAFDERINEEDSMPTLINSPAGEDPAITAVDDCDRRVDIQRVNNGFVVQVGCQSIAFETSEHLCAAIKLFYEDPAKARKKYLHNPDAQ